MRPDLLTEEQPPERLDLGDGDTLITISATEPAMLFELIERNREHLRDWLPWVDRSRETSESEAFISLCGEEIRDGRGVHYAIWSSAELSGVVSLHVNRAHRTASAGVWLAAARQGRGLATRALRVLCDYGIKVMGLARVEYAAATENTASRALADRSGFTFEGVLRNREFINGRHVDHAVYSRISPGRDDRP